MTFAEQMEQSFFNIYKMDYDFGFVNKDYMKNLVVQGFLSAPNYKKIVGEDYVADSAQPQTTTQN